MNTRITRPRRRAPGGRISWGLLLAAGVSISVRRVSDGAVLTETVPLGLPGLYVILTDGNIDDVSENGTAVEVVGTLEDMGFRAEYVFDRDACRCHVNKLSGPDTVQLEPLPLG